MSSSTVGPRHVAEPRTCKQARTATRTGALTLLVLWSCYDVFWNLANSNVGYDENIYVRAGWQYVHGDFSANREHPPVAKYLFGLAQLIGGQGTLAPRILVAFLVLAGGVILFLWLRKELGFWGGFLAAALWELIPRGVPDNTLIRIDHFALLEPVMGFFAIIALATACMYLRFHKAWWWAAVSGAAMAASMLSKVSSAPLIVAFLIFPFVLPREKRTRAVLRYYLLWLGAFVVAFVALYFPIGIISDIKYMVTFQGEQNSIGHAEYIAGHTYIFSPWWANFWYAASGMGILVTILICAGIVCAFIVHPDRLVISIALSFVTLIIFYCFVARVASEYYYYPFLIFGVILASIGYARLSQMIHFQQLYRVGTGVVVAAGIVGAAHSSATLWSERLNGIALVSPILQSHGFLCSRGSALVYRLGISYAPYISCPSPLVNTGIYSAILIGDDPRSTVPTVLQKFIVQNPSHYTKIIKDDVTIYILKTPIRYLNNELEFVS